MAATTLTQSDGFGERPRCDGCVHYKPGKLADSSPDPLDGTCHVFGPPFKPVKADDFCQRHPDWDRFLEENGLLADDPDNEDF